MNFPYHAQTGLESEGHQATAKMIIGEDQWRCEEEVARYEVVKTLSGRSGRTGISPESHPLRWKHDPGGYLICDSGAENEIDRFPRMANGRRGCRKHGFVVCVVVHVRTGRILSGESCV